MRQAVRSLRWFCGRARSMWWLRCVVSAIPGKRIRCAGSLSTGKRRANVQPALTRPRHPRRAAMHRMGWQWRSLVAATKPRRNLGSSIGADCVLAPRSEMPPEMVGARKSCGQDARDARSAATHLPAFGLWRSVHKTDTALGRLRAPETKPRARNGRKQDAPDTAEQGQTGAPVDHTKRLRARICGGESMKPQNK